MQSSLNRCFTIENFKHILQERKQYNESITNFNNYQSRVHSVSFIHLTHFSHHHPQLRPKLRIGLGFKIKNEAR